MSKAGAVEREQFSYSSRGADDSGNGNTVEVRFRISAASDAYSGLSIVGNTAELGEWDVSKSVRLKQSGMNKVRTKILMYLKMNEWNALCAYLCL